MLQRLPFAPSRNHPHCFRATAWREILLQRNGATEISLNGLNVLHTIHSSLKTGTVCREMSDSVTDENWGTVSELDSESLVSGYESLPTT